MENIGNMQFSYHGEKKIKIEEDTTRVAPLSPKPPPPKPPSTYSSDKPAEKGAGEEKENRGKFRFKMGGRKEKNSKEKMIPKEKGPKEIPDEEGRCQQWEKRIAMLHRVDIPRRQRGERTGRHRIGERITRIISGRVEITGSLPTEHGSWRIQKRKKLRRSAAQLES